MLLKKLLIEFSLVVTNCKKKTEHLKAPALKNQHAEKSCVVTYLAPIHLVYKFFW